MIKIENTEVYGFAAALRGMRNPLNSWAKSDSEYHILNDEYIIGENDLKLMKSLVKAGTDHSKFMRMINVACDITAPVYWIAEHDTYKIGTTRNSCSFMHKGTSEPFTIADFSTCNQGDEASSSLEHIWEQVVNTLNQLRDEYLKTKDSKIFQQIRCLLPSGYNQRYTWTANYQVLRNIYHSRRNHRLDEWKTFCKWIESLPYSELITM